MPALSLKDELLLLEARKAELQSRLDAPKMPELLHPRMAHVYREKVGSLCLALESGESRTGAVEAIRALIEAILLEPDGDQLISAEILKPLRWLTAARVPLLQTKIACCQGRECDADASP